MLLLGCCSVATSSWAAVAADVGYCSIQCWEDLKGLSCKWWISQLPPPIRSSYDDIFILCKNALFLCQVKILHKWLNILHKFYVTMFTPEHSLPQRSTPPPTTWPAFPPVQSPDPARHLTLPATLPGPPPHPAATHPVCLPSRTASSATSA